MEGGEQGKKGNISMEDVETSTRNISGNIRVTARWAYANGTKPGWVVGPN